MNSYFLGISGSLWLLITFCIIAVIFAIYTYWRTVPPITQSKKTLLIILRSLALIILIFVLYKPVYNIISATELKPRLDVLLDNSLSMTARDAGGERKNDYLSAIDNSKFEQLGDEQLSIYSFNGDIKSIENFTQDSLNFQGNQTNISKALGSISENAGDRNVQAALLISDGSFNAGNNPVYNAEEFGRPVYVIGIGDSTEPKDISIQSIVTNEVAYINNPVPVNVNVQVNGFSGEEVTVELFDNGKKLKEQVFTAHQDRNQYPVIFEYDPKTEGNHKLTAKVTNKGDEITDKNNTATEFIKVIDNKRKVVIFAGAPSPDLAFIKNELSKEEGLEIHEYVQKQGSEFYKDPDPQVLAQSQIIFLIGFPISTTPQNVLQSLRNQLSRGKSVFFIGSNDIDYKKLKTIQDYLPFDVVSSNQREYLAAPEVKEQYLTSPLLRVEGTASDIDKWNSLPPIFRTETFVKVKPEAEVVADVKVNNISLNEPLILSRSFGNQKSVAILGYGLYRWKLLGYAADVSKNRQDVSDLFTQFLRNSVRWLALEDQLKQVRIRTDKELYTTNEKIIFYGQVYDAAFVPVNNARVVVTVTSDNEQREIILNSTGNGRYSGSIESLREGDYSFTGRALVNNNVLGSDNGRFTVGDVALEYQNLRMNAQLLRMIAERTGGKFYTVENAGQFMDDLRNQKSFSSKHVTNRAEINLWNNSWLLIVSIVLFGIEWFIRKRSGMI